MESLLGGSCNTVNLSSFFVLPVTGENEKWIHISHCMKSKNNCGSLIHWMKTSLLLKYKPDFTMLT